MREKKGQRGKQAALRDAIILLLVERGSTNKEIADILEIPADHVKAYRRAMKERIERKKHEHK